MIMITIPEWFLWVLTAYVAFKLADMAMGLWIRTLNQQLMKENFKKVEWLFHWARTNDEQKDTSEDETQPG